MCCVRLSVFCLAAVPLLSVGPALLAVVFLSCCFPGLLFGASVVVGCVAARLVAAVQVFWHPFSGHNWASPWFMSCHDMPCFSIPPQVCPAFMGRACVRVEFKMQGCTKTLVSGGDIETNHLSVLAEPSRLHSWSWRQNIVLLFGSSSFDKLLSQFKKWNQMLMTWHYKCLYKQFCPSVCVCVYVCMCLRNCVGHLTWSGQTCISRIVWVHGCNSWERNDESRLDLLLIVVHISSRWFGYVLRVADMMRLSEKGCTFCMWWTPPTTVSWQESEAPKPAGSAVRNQKARQ